MEARTTGGLMISGLFLPRRDRHSFTGLFCSPRLHKVRPSLPRCGFAPDAFLWNVPFQALMTPNEHFLIEDHAVYYAPSLSVLWEMSRKRSTSQKTDSSLIAFGNPVIGKDEQRNVELCPLPEAETEVSSIAKSLAPGSSKVFIGRDASEKTFKALAPTYSVIHLATHGVIDNRQPLYSHLLLTKTEGDVENDGRLEARQIMDMNLRADLAVLSACETANGKIAPGEGVIGTSWAFFVAGTRSMLVSQWKINSASTSELMVRFYKNLNLNNGEAHTKNARAFRDASVLMINDPRYRHPFFWWFRNDWECDVIALRPTRCRFGLAPTHAVASTSPRLDSLQGGSSPSRRTYLTCLKR